METIIKFKKGSYVEVLADKPKPKCGRRAKLYPPLIDALLSSILKNNLERGEDMSTQIVCNKCGKSFDMWDKQEDFSIYSTLGYGTKYDGSKLELDLCCDCMEKLIDDCKVSPIVDNDN